ncbi:E3 ubiquitin-protein ligase RNF14-like [Papaver somniferum]|uniref:E3 ubiquitin-protein ligase RNF14-like n=1 Tax=Papaver somniferum TaxID=3469 RepID=UPI000E6F6DB8|nr:E3 ubiquitin-protein ligase RNF14-like [Papaver somniferum]
MTAFHLPYGFPAFIRCSLLPQQHITLVLFFLHLGKVEKKQKRNRERGSPIEIIDLENPKSKVSFGFYIDLTIDDDDDEIVEIKSVRSITLSGVKVIDEFNYRSGSKKMKKDEESFVCEICVETKMVSESFQVKGCAHSYCSECMVRYVASKIQENVISTKCPEWSCQGVLEPEFCKSILPPDVFDRWGKAQCEALLLGDQNIYCPFKDCSAPLLDEGGGKIIRSECPHCNRLICARCKVSWHEGVRCATFQKLNADDRENEDITLHAIAKRKKWKRCPKCKFYVGKSYGCSTLTCRCGLTFYYKTGTPTYDFSIPQMASTQRQPLLSQLHPYYQQSVSIVITPQQQRQQQGSNLENQKMLMGYQVVECKEDNKQFG